MATDTLYYICQSEDAGSGLFGAADACAYWYLTYGGADYRVSPKSDARRHDTNDVTACGVDVADCSKRVWNVAFKAADNSHFRESPITVTGADENQADKALRCAIVETRLLGSIDVDDNFYMISAEQALPILMRVAEMREIYDLAGQPQTDNENDVKTWFWNTEHGRQALLRMADLLACRPRMALPPAHAEQIKTQIEAIAAAPGMLTQHKTAIAHHHFFTARALS